jgi:hypothetical protein
MDILFIKCLLCLRVFHINEFSFFLDCHKTSINIARVRIVIQKFNPQILNINHHLKVIFHFIICNSVRQLNCVKL